MISRQFDEKAIEDLKIIFRSKTLDEWEKLNEKHDFCCEPVKRLSEVINDNNINNSGIIINIDGIKQAAFPALFSSSKKINYHRAPKLDEHDNIIRRFKNGRI